MQNTYITGAIIFFSEITSSLKSFILKMSFILGEHSKGKLAIQVRKFVLASIQRVFSSQKYSVGIVSLCTRT